MKKTLITLLALTGIAGAATVTLDDATAWMGHFNDGNWYSSGITQTTNSDGDWIFNADTGIKFAETGNYQTGTNAETGEATYADYTVTSVAITLDFSKITLPTVNPVTKDDGTTAVGGTSLLVLECSTDIGLGYSSNGKLTGIWGSNYAYYESATLSGMTGEHTFVFSFSNNGTRIYSDNQNTFWSKPGLKGNVSDCTTITLEDWAVDGLRSIAIWSGTHAYDDKAMAGSMIAVSQMIPEPATATLSLLALAGLAARRRRR